MIRVRSLDESLEFYQKVLGFNIAYRQDFTDDAFTIVYMVRKTEAEIPKDEVVRRKWVLSQSGVLELTWNHGTEQLSEFSYHNGNDDPRGFGHLCIVVDNITEACERFERLNVPFRKRLADGRMKDVAFIVDPDGYWIEILQLPE